MGVVVLWGLGQQDFTEGRPTPPHPLPPGWLMGPYGDWPVWKRLKQGQLRAVRFPFPPQGITASGSLARDLSKAPPNLLRGSPRGQPHLTQPPALAIARTQFPAVGVMLGWVTTGQMQQYCPWTAVRPNNRHKS